MPQMIGSAISANSANDWQRYEPTPSAPQGDSSLGNIAGGVGALIGGGGPATAAALYASMQGGGGNIGNLSRGIADASLAYGGLNKLTGGATANAGVSGALGTLGGGLQFLQGIQRGGVQGYGSAAVGALRGASGIESMLGNSGAAGTLSSAAGYVAAPLALYNAVANYQSGDTAGDAMRGMQAGAAIGSVIVPGIGTLVGGAIGAGVGAISSAFGNGKVDPETNNWQSFINATHGANPNAAQVAQMTSTQNMGPQQAFNLLAGVMDIKDGRIPITNAFGQKSEGALVSQMTSQVSNAIKSGKIGANATPQQMYNQIVTPWLNSKGATIGAETGGIQLQGVLTNLLGHWQNGSLTDNTVLTSGGSKDTTIPAFPGS
jgi:hypothetical protein